MAAVADATERVLVLYGSQTGTAEVSATTSAAVIAGSRSLFARTFGFHNAGRC